MPFRPEHSLLRVEMPGIRTIDTTSVENLFGMWSLFSKTSHAMEDGKRLENLSWRLWNRETFCCTPESQLQSRSAPATKAAAHDIPVPALSTSLDSASSSDELGDDDTTLPSLLHSRPELRHRDSRDSTPSSLSRTPKHITPMDLEKIVLSMKETDLREPIDLPMPTPSLPAMNAPSADASQVLSSFELDSRESPCTHSSASRSTYLESSSSTVETNASNPLQDSQTVGSENSTSTEMSGHSIVRGFAPSSYRSQTNLAFQQAPILKTSPSYRQLEPKKKTAMFTIGGTSSDDDHESSLESRFKSSLSASLKRPSNMPNKKQNSFKDDIANGKAALHHSPVFESDDEDESAIEEDDDSSDWEDSDDQSRSSSMNENFFQRVDSRPDLTSRRSLLTKQLHEPDRQRALAMAAARPTAAMRRSRTSTPNGPSVAGSPEPGAHLQLPGEMQRSKPIIMTTSNTHQPLSLSPRTTRRNMLSTELTESLRKNLLWERQHKSTGNLAALKRRHTSTDVKNLKQHPEPAPVMSHRDTSRFTNAYFDAGLGQYHEKGW